jgi:hypothetical protein
MHFAPEMMWCNSLTAGKGTAEEDDGSYDFL